MTVEPTRRLSPGEYLTHERTAETRSELYAGELFAMSGASRGHNLIVTNLVRVLGTQLLGRECELYANDMRVRIPQTSSYTYPDLVVVCGEPRFEDGELDTLVDPTLIVEVLSPSTADYDRSGKFEHYRTLPSLLEYLVLAQDRAHAELWVRQPDGRWLFSDVSSREAVLRLSSIGCELPLAEVYRRVLEV
jgi:Uma2 family endonuclease